MHNLLFAKSADEGILTYNPESDEMPECNAYSALLRDVDDMHQYLDISVIICNRIVTVFLGSPRLILIAINEPPTCNSQLWNDECRLTKVETRNPNPAPRHFSTLTNHPPSL